MDQDQLAARIAQAGDWGWATLDFSMEGLKYRPPEMPRGGHFAALEEPQLLAEDVRAFFRPLRPN